MRKIVATGTLVLVAVATLAGVTAAFADDKRPSPGATPANHGEPINRESESDDEYEDDGSYEGDSDEERRAHHEIELKYGKDGAFQIPPLVIKPGQTIDDSRPSSNLGSAVTGPAGLKGQSSSLQGSVEGGTATVNSVTGSSTSLEWQNPLPGSKNPIATAPIDFSKIVLHQQSPAETFMQVSSTALIVMALGAVGFGGYLLVNRSSRDRIHPADEEYSA